MVSPRGGNHDLVTPFWNTESTWIVATATYFQYVARLQTPGTSHPIFIWNAIHAAIAAWITGETDDPVKVFVQLLADITETIALDYNSLWSPESLEATGKALVEQFIPVWQKSGIMPLLDEEGKPAAGTEASRRFVG